MDNQHSPEASKYNRDMGRFRDAQALSARAMPEQVQTPGVAAVAAGSAPRRPLRRDNWVRGYTCAVAVLVQNYPDPSIVQCLLTNGVRADEILRHADEEDIATLRSAGFLGPNTKV